VQWHAGVGPVGPEGLHKIVLAGAWEAARQIVLRRDGHRCVQCGGDLKADGAHVHHVLPRASGGTEVVPNRRTI
jgi:ATP-dependent DNA helicase RecQ